MITAINSVNSNKNINFKGIGRGKMGEATYYTLDDLLITTLSQSKSPFWGVVADRFRMDLGNLMDAHKGFNLEAINRTFQSIRKACLGAEALRRDSHASTILIPRTWFDGKEQNIKSFAAEIEEYFIGLRILDGEKRFALLRERTREILPGFDKIPDNFEDIADTVVVRGTIAENPYFKDAKFNGVEFKNVNSSGSTVANAREVVINNSRIGDLRGQNITIENSIIMGDVATSPIEEENVQRIHIKGKAVINGNILSDRPVFCENNSRVKIHGDVLVPDLNGDFAAPYFHVGKRAQVVIGGKAGTGERKLYQIRVKGGRIDAGEIHANDVYCTNGGEARTNVMDVPNWAKVWHKLGFNRHPKQISDFEIEGLGPNPFL